MVHSYNMHMFSVLGKSRFELDHINIESVLRSNATFQCFGDFLWREMTNPSDSRKSGGRGVQLKLLFPLKKKEI